MLQALLRLVGRLPVQFRIAALYQVGKLAATGVGPLRCLRSSKQHSQSIHNGDRNRLWPRESFIEEDYEEKA